MSLNWIGAGSLRGWLAAVPRVHVSKEITGSGFEDPGEGIERLEGWESAAPFDRDDGVEAEPTPCRQVTDGPTPLVSLLAK